MTTEKTEAPEGKVDVGEAIYQQLHIVLINIQNFLIGIGMPSETLGVSLIIRDSESAGRAMFLTTDQNPTEAFEVAEALISGATPSVSHGISEPEPSEQLELDMEEPA